MSTLLLTIGMIGLLMAAMSVGVIVSGKRLKGSCGGVGNACPCDLAGKLRACEQPGGGPDPVSEPAA